ncbi:MAG: hypothetical protein COA79_18760 [Planctomycetota bacterium]|nr:MAG: hypothetical protein COA79_18760 [Planctomycetota bacterium]
MISENDSNKLLGLLALEKGWVTKDELNNALREHGKTGEFLGTILISKNLINKMQRDELLVIQKDSQAREDEYLFGTIAVNNKFLSADQLMQGLEIHKKDFFRNNIGDVLIKEGFMSQQECDAVLKSQKRLKEKIRVEEKFEKSKCPKCEFIYKIKDPDRYRKVRCKKCQYIFEVGTQELKATSSQIIRLHEETVKANKSVTNNFYEYLVENDMINENQEIGQENISDKQRYIIGDEIARGGMGVILSTKDSNLRRQIVTKVHLKNNSKLATLRFIDEAQITGQLEHPNIPPVYDLGINKEEQIFFTMKHIKGETLDSIIHKLSNGDKKTEEKYNTNQIINIFLQLCDALNYAHSKRVLHRDIKPDNIMIGEFGEVLLMDWGLAKTIGSKEDVEDLSGYGTDKISSVRGDDDFSQTMEGTTAGTPLYMSPEQALGYMDELDERSDLYSLGATLYYAISLQKPLSGKTLADILNNAARGKIRRLPDEVPSELASIIRKSMEKNTRDRYESVSEFEEDLLKYQMGYAVSVKQDNIFEVVKKLYMRNKLIFTLEGVVGIIVLLGSFLFISMLNQQRRGVDEQRESAEKSLNQTTLLLAKFEKEKVKRKEQNFESAPTYYAKAQLEISKKSYKAGMENINLAIQYDPSKPEFYCFRGGLYLLKKTYDRAQKDFKFCVSKKYIDKSANALLKLISSIRKKEKIKNSNSLLIKYLIEMRLFDIAETFSADIKMSSYIWNKKLSYHWPQKGYSLTLKPSGRLYFAVPRDVGGKDLNLLRGMKINEIYLNRSNINSIDFIEGMPLEKVTINMCKNLKSLDVLSKHRLISFSLRYSTISTLNFLKNSRLEFLYLERLPLESLEPLRGQPIKDLTIYFIKTEDLNVTKSFRLERMSFCAKVCKNLDFLRGQKIKEFASSWTTLNDISALKTIPIERLYLYSCHKFDLKILEDLKLKVLGFRTMKTKDFKFILKIKSLEKLIINPDVNTPKNWVQTLKRHPNKNLKFANVHNSKVWLPISKFVQTLKKKK